jgi:(p)ppGpp synthase/HD superfamily hydrolase
MARLLSERFGEAAAWATDLHADHLRKGTSIPYVSHLFAVASLVLEDGGGEDEAIAALLHDSVEDDKTTLDAIESRFGADVRAMVDACSDTTETPKPPWRGRKERYIAHLHDPATSSGALRVSAADKVHNARCLLADYKSIGEDLWQRFNPDAQSAEMQLWYYESLVAAFETRRPDSALTAELARIVAELREATSGVTGDIR